jgi:hypothetical protein
MKNELNNFPLTLKEIASWQDIPEITERPEVRASVPVLQRGLIWNPAQIELLWDSILRGFPIGALVLSAKIARQEKETDQQKLGVTHHLLDGQQRCDAITLAFKDPFRDAGTEMDTKASESILWLDLNPADDAWNTREFLVRLTTPSHPWGYARNDSANPLRAGAIREALWSIKADPAAIGYKRPSPAELSPHVAVAPMPLSWLLLAAEKETDLWDAIKNRLDHSAARPWHECLRKFLNDDAGKDQRAKLLRTIKRIEATRIVALCAPADLLEGSRQESASSPERKNISNIEHLFQRLNQQGTPLDGEELAYSMIKAYWPELAGPIDRIAKQLPATRLISLGIRAALSNEDRERLPNGLGVSGIRTMARKNDEKASRVYHYIKDELGPGCKQIEAWLRYEKADNPSGLLPVHIGSIAHDSPDLFLLLLIFAKRPAADWEQAATDWPKRLQALVTVIHWFGRNKENIVNGVFATCAVQISLANIKRALADAFKAGDLRPVHTPTVVEDFVKVTKGGLMSWDWGQLVQGDGTDEAKQKLWNQWGEFMWFRGQKELLLYAQRDYLHRRFSDYDPARKDFWKAHNRPWDFDHILAATYLRYCRGDFKPVCDKWVGTIGNFRAWPFEDNRSEQAETALEKLSGDGVDLKRINSFLEIEELPGFSVGKTVGDSPDDAHAFITVCRSRMLRIYREWYESVRVAELLTTVEDARSLATEPTTMTELPATNHNAETNGK